MRFIFFYTNAVNGEDAVGHYVRSGLNLFACVRGGRPTGGCESDFDSSASAAEAAHVRDADTILDYLLGPEEERR
jgi:hypothetical protein